MKVNITNMPNWKFYHHWLHDWFGYTPTQKTNIKIHNYDTWQMDDTLAPIILLMLKQLKKTKHRGPKDDVDMKDVPKQLRQSTADYYYYKRTGETDPNRKPRWDHIVDEMIWAFEQKCHHHQPDDKEHQTRMDNGFLLFGKYYEELRDN